MLAFNLFLVFQSLLDEGYGGYPTWALLLAGAIPAGLLIVIGVLVARLKGAGDEDED